VFVANIQARDNALSAPQLLFPSLPVNINTGNRSAPGNNEVAYLKVPLNHLQTGINLRSELAEGETKHDAPRWNGGLTTLRRITGPFYGAIPGTPKRNRRSGALCPAWQR
jgi:hypothetical protein